LNLKLKEENLFLISLSEVWITHRSFRRSCWNVIFSEISTFKSIPPKLQIRFALKYPIYECIIPILFSWYHANPINWIIKSCCMVFRQDSYISLFH